MQKTFKNFFLLALDALIPARRTERVVRTLSMDKLLAMAAPDGSLPYHNPMVRALIWELKYRGNGAAAALAGEYLSDLVLAEASELIGTPLIIPMPMHAARRKERGYNQTELLCEAALKFLGGGFRYAPDVLERVRHTAPQQGLARHKRLTNVTKSMHVKDPARVRSRVCIVVDDVSTTGASFEEATRALVAAGASEVRCLPLARS